MKIIKTLIFSFILFSATLITFAAETAQDVYKALDGTLEISEVSEGKLTNDKSQQFLQKNNNLTKSVKDYTFIETNSMIGTLTDSCSTLHALKFVDLEESSNDQLKLTVSYASEYEYFKDSNLVFEFYRSNKSNELDYMGNVSINTYGVNSTNIYITFNKEMYADEAYIYVKVGTEDTMYPGYFSDLIQFKIFNPYSGKFKDVEKTDWYYSYINNFVNKGYISGYKDGTFRPNASITRAEFVKIVNRTFGLTSTTTTKFTDIKKDWQKKEAAIGVKAGYLTNSKNFRPDDTITREEACKIVGVIAKLVGDGKLHYKDKNEIAKYAKVYVDGLVEAGVLSKLDYFRPKDSLTRAEAVKILQVVSEL